MKLQKLETLDGLRGLAVLMVLWSHFPQVGDSSISVFVRTAAYYCYTGYFGVDIFFALSGFLITRILISDKQQGLPMLKRFYLKRVLRIFPVYYLCILVVGVLMTWDEMGWVGAYLSNYFFAFNPLPHPMRHSWSLCVEEHFYLAWPLIISLFALPASKKIISIVVPMVGLLSAAFFLLYYESPLSENLIYRATNTRILTLSIGSAIAFQETHIRSMKAKWAMAAFLLILLLFAFMRSHYKIPVLDQLSAPLIKYLMSSAIAILSLLIFIYINEHQNWLRTVAVNAPLRYVGKISYGLYLYHYPIFYYIGITDSQITTSVSPTVGASAIALCFGVASLSYFLIEAPLLRLKDRL